MKYKKQIWITIFFLTIVLFFIVLKGYQTEYLKADCFKVYGSLLGCVDVIIFGNYQVISLFSFSILLSLIPLYFLKEEVYVVWRKFALVALPIIALLIFLSPISATGDYVTLGYTREIASMFFSGLFLLISWSIATYHALKKYQ